MVTYLNIRSPTLVLLLNQFSIIVPQGSGQAKEGCATGGPTEQPRPPGPELNSGRKTPPGRQRGAPWWRQPPGGRGSVRPGGPAEAQPVVSRRQSGEMLSRLCRKHRPTERTAQCDPCDPAAGTERRHDLPERHHFTGGLGETCAEEEHIGSGGALGQSSQRRPTQEVSVKPVVVQKMLPETDMVSSKPEKPQKKQKKINHHNHA